LHQFCHMSSLVYLWGCLLSCVKFRNKQQHETCGLGRWPNQLFGHFYFKRLPSHYGCFRLRNLILLEIIKYCHKIQDRTHIFTNREVWYLLFCTQASFTFNQFKYIVMEEHVRCTSWWTIMTEMQAWIYFWQPWKIRCVYCYITFLPITGKANALIKSYLKDKYQRVIINNKDFNHNTFPTSGKIKHGVPQQSILGPLLFLLYTNDLPKIINTKSKPILFADNTSMIVTNPSP
jgi:hypothetical protein